ncbi:MAG: fimbria/pilus periplasmic chaperone [Pseudomonadota bacterium]
MRLLTRRLTGGVSFFALACRSALPAAALMLAASAALLVAGPAAAAGLQVTPISLDIPAAQQSQAMFLSNSGKTPLRAQVRVQQWTQEGGSEKLEATRDVVASPPIVEIAPGARQMVRIVRLQPAPAAREKTYRLIIDELPGADGAQQPAAAGLQFLLRYSVPVFVLPSSAAGSAALPPASAANGTVPLTDVKPLSASIRANGPDASMLVVVNTGVRRAKISQLAWVDARGQRSMQFPGLMGYVLAGQTMQWPLALPLPTLRSGGAFKAKFNDDQEEQTLPLTDRP